MHIHIKKTLPKRTVVFDTYWKFAYKRQNIFFNRINNVNPITSDTILKEYKFTNAYRASDRVSQYLIKNVINKGDQSLKELFFRILLFKTFNKIKTWETLEKRIGEIRFSTYDFNKYSSILNTELRKRISIYSGAYIMTSGKSKFGFNRKHSNHLKLIELMIENNLPELIADSNSLEEVFLLLRRYPTIGNFLAFQYCIDLNYSDLINFSEMDFVVPGPGAKDGIKKCFSNLSNYSETDIIHYMADIQEKEFERLELDFQDLWGRKLSLIDCQNLFCEVDKYSRIAHPNINGISGRKRIKQKFHPSNDKIKYWYPPKWGINDRIYKIENKASG